jgi:hypothetical protein
MLWALSHISLNSRDLHDNLFAMVKNHGFVLLFSLITILYVSLCILLLVYLFSSNYISEQQQVSSFNYYLSLHIDGG